MICVFAEVFWRKMIILNKTSPHFQLLPMSLEG